MSIGIKLKSQLDLFSQGQLDIDIDGAGKPLQTSGQDKLLEDIQKLLFTTIHPFWAEFSTDLTKMVGTNIGLEQTKERLGEIVIDALVYYQQLQKEQLKYQPIDAGEFLKKVDFVEVDYLGELPGNDGQNDMFTFNVRVAIQNELQQQIVVQKTVDISQ